MSTRLRPLEGLRVVELAGIGPAPFASGILFDLGADVVRIERPVDDSLSGLRLERLGVRGCVIVELDLKADEDRTIADDLIASADVVIEGFRPGVAERLGYGPDDVRASNPGAVYARITGWGQDGPYAQMAGHDINYLAVTGALDAIGIEQPVPPLNLLADYAGGSLFAVIGILASLLARAEHGTGATVDAAMVDGVGALLTPVHQLRGWGVWVDERNSNLLDGRAPFYRTYRTSDGRFIAVGALEPAFWLRMLEGLGIDPASLPPREDPRNWDSITEVLEGVFSEETRDHWASAFQGTDACVTPVLEFSESTVDPHAVARGAFTEEAGIVHPAGAPRIDGAIPRTRAERSVSDTLMALGLTAGVARDLEGRGASYWA